MSMHYGVGHRIRFVPQMAHSLLPQLFLSQEQRECFEKAPERVAVNLNDEQFMDHYRRIVHDADPDILR